MCALLCGHCRIEWCCISDSKWCVVVQRIYYNMTSKLKLIVIETLTQASRTTIKPQCIDSEVTIKVWVKNVPIFYDYCVYEPCVRVYRCGYIYRRNLQCMRVSSCLET